MSGSTGSIGGGQPFYKLQPSRAVTEVTLTAGIFPGGGGGSASGDMLGFTDDFAGNFAPAGGLFLQGQTLSISQNSILFDILGTTYGGDGTTTFALPDLRGMTLVGMGTNSGANYTFGGTYGSDTTTLTVANLPVESASLSCFAEGSRIATPSGQVPVESLAIGDVVLTRDGEASPIAWIGFRHVNCRRHARPTAVQPVCIATNAFAPGCPSRDLRLSPDHAVWFDGVLIPIKHLINASTVRQMSVREVTYFRIELATHDIVLANDLPVESYLDTGDRAAFANGGRASLAPRVWGRHEPGVVAVGGGGPCAVDRGRPAD
jgi:microcystin-dependent protein